MRKSFCVAIAILLSLNFIYVPVTETETDDGISVVSDFEIPANPQNFLKN